MHRVMLNSKHRYSIALCVVLIYISALVSLIIQPFAMSELNPSYIDFAKQLPVADFGPTAPIVVSPGECFTGTLTGDYEIKYIYLWTIKGEELKLLNYTLKFEKISGSTLRICVPEEVDNGVYDLELVADNAQYSVPRSVWIIKQLDNKLRVVVMSDLHFGAGPVNVTTGDINRYSAAVLATSLNPTLILWAGDIADTASESETRLAQTYRYMMLYSYPVLGVPGNHDHLGENYRKYLGPTRWARVISNKTLVIGIYTTPYFSENNVITWDEIVFLEEALRNYSYVPYKIIVTHYPMFYYQGELITRYDDESLQPYTQGSSTPVSSYWSGNMTAFRYVLKLIEDYNVTAVISGHIHVDQYVKYTSTRTNTTTYFITVTTAAHGSSTYQGITVFDLDLNTGELMFPVKPPGFIGFNNSTSRSASNSIPVSIVESKVIRAPLFYKLSVYNRASWYTVNASTIMVLPWSTSLEKIQIRQGSVNNNAELIISKHDVIGDRLFVNILMNIPPKTSAEVSVSGIDDTSPPRIELTGKKYSPPVPVLNKTLTLYFKVTDDAWGLDYSNYVFRYNGTSIKVEYSPQTIMTDLNEMYLTITLTVKGVNKTLTILEIYVEDNYGHSILRKYGIIFYPAGVTPVEDPVFEVIETTSPITITSPPITMVTNTTTTGTTTYSTYTSTSTTQTQSTPTAITTSLTKPTTQTYTTSPTPTMTISTSEQPASTSETKITTSTQLAIQQPSYTLVLTGIVVVTVVIVVIASYIALRKKIS